MCQLKSSVVRGKLQQFVAMTVVKKALAAVRYEPFPEDAVYTEGSKRWVKIEALYVSHRRFMSEFDLFGFFLELRNAKRRDNTNLFEFFGVPDDVIVHHQFMPGTWVSAPIANR